jgi:hypothetical protein
MFKLSDLYGFYEKDPEYCGNRVLVKPCDCFQATFGLEKVDRLATGNYIFFSNA